MRSTWEPRSLTAPLSGRGGGGVRYGRASCSGNLPVGCGGWESNAEPFGHPPPPGPPLVLQVCPEGPYIAASSVT